MELDGKSWKRLVYTNKEKAYCLLVQTYASRVYNICFRFTFNREDAEDLTQEVFTAIYVSIESFKGDSKLSTWIYSIAINKSKEFIRFKLRDKRNSSSTISLDLLKDSVGFDVPSENDPLKELILQERLNILYQSILELPENQRIAYTLNKLDGLSYQEVADSMELSISAVESLLFRAKQGLYNSIQKKLMR